MSIRTERVARLLQREIADVLQTEFHEASQSMMTVTEVRVTNDLSIATVFVSVLGETTQQRQAAFRRLDDLTPQVRAALSKRIRHQMRVMPEVRFKLDESLHRAADLENLFSQIRAEREARTEGSEEE